jgi:nucleoside 2-deoxyribosyltransferase
MGDCKICGSQCREFSANTAHEQAYRIECPRCGEYEITDKAQDLCPDEFVKSNLHFLSSLARSSWARRKRFHIDAKLLRDRSEFEARVLSQCPRRVQDRINTILFYLASKSKCIGYEVRITPDEDCVDVYCKNGLEMGSLLDSLAQRALLDVQHLDGKYAVRLTADGWAQVEELESPNVESKQAFVAMWFEEELDPAFKDGILPLEGDTGFRMLRIDMKEFNDKICDHIIAEIRRSRFLIADVTGHRHAVYFEAGYARGLGLDVIWTCREDAMEETAQKFDTRQYNHITWKTPGELRERLRDRILATIDRAS